jgi:hypothetical protein
VRIAADTIQHESQIPQLGNVLTQALDQKSDKHEQRVSSSARKVTVKTHRQAISWIVFSLQQVQVDIRLVVWILFVHQFELGPNKLFNRKAGPTKQ